LGGQTINAPVEDDMTEQAVNFDLQDKIYRLIQENPDWRQYLEEMVQYEDDHYRDEYYAGWEWKTVHTSPGSINRMISAGIVDFNESRSSRRSSYYSLRSREDTRSALQLGETDDTAEGGPQFDADGLFEMVIGHDRVKQLLRFSLKAERPVHVLLHGPVATAKSLLLEDIGRLPGAQMYLGSTTTKSGLVQMMINYKPTYLVIDEIDKMPTEDRQPLLSLMASGKVYRLQSGRNDQVSMQTRVFAGANDVGKVDPPIFSRFVKIAIPAYSHQEFVETAKWVLTRQQGLGPDMALLVANMVSQHTLDIRQAVYVARMAKGHPTRVKDIVDALWPQASGRVTPLRK